MNRIAQRKRALWRRAVLGVLSLMAVAVAIAAATALPGPGNAGQGKDKFLDIRVVESAGGVTAWLVEDHNLPVIAMSFAFTGAGAARDPADKQGLSLLVSNTMDEGAGPYDSQQFQKLLTDHAISLSFGSGRDNFSGSVKTLTRHKDLAFDLLKLALTQPRFDAEAVERMRAANMARVRNAVGDPDWIAARIMNDTAFAGHPYALNSGGTLTTLAAITPDDLRQWTKERLGRDRLLVAVTGDIDAPALRKILDEVFGALPAKTPVPAHDAAIPALTVRNGGTHTHYDMDIPQTIMQAMQEGIGRADPDYYAAAIMDFILGGSGFGSRLTEEIREKRGLTYGIGTGFYQLDHVQAYSVSTSTRNESAAEVWGLIRAAWKQMRDNDVSESELADAKSYLVGSLPLALSSSDAIAGLMLGLRLEGLPLDYLDRRAAKIEAVTAADVRRVAERLLTPDGMTLVTVGRPADMTPTRIVTELPHVD